MSKRADSSLRYVEPMNGLHTVRARRVLAIELAAPELAWSRWLRGVFAFAGLALLLVVARMAFVGTLNVTPADTAPTWLTALRVAFVTPPILLFAVLCAYLDVVPVNLRPGALLTAGGLALWMGYEVGVAWGGISQANQSVDLAVGGVVVTGVVLYLLGGLLESRSMRLLAESDPLTGLLNRAGAQRAWEALPSHADSSLAMVDLNDLKVLNDGLGHAAGDRLILACARALARVCGERGWVARWGGDEFIVVLPNVSEADARRLLSTAEAKLTSVIGDLPVWAIGIASAQPERPLREAIQLADARMYHEKAAQYQVRRTSRATMGSQPQLT